MKYTFSRSSLGQLVGLIALAISSAPASALTIQLGANASWISDTPFVTCQQDIRDRCRVHAWISPAAATATSAIFRDAFANWAGLPGNAGWRVINGGNTDLTVTLDTFKAYNDCPEKGGVKIRASFATARNVKWAQGLWATPLNSSTHGGNVPPKVSYMDVGTTGNESPPLYPYSYADGHFYDRPGRRCVENATVSWSAVCLMATVNSTDKTLTTYDGFTYGFDVICVAVPEPATIVALAVGLSVLLRRRTR